MSGGYAVMGFATGASGLECSCDPQGFSIQLGIGPNLQAKLPRLADSGLFGNSKEEAAVRAMERGLEAILLSGVLDK